jgi:hypothetical protein
MNGAVPPFFRLYGRDGVQVPDESIWMGKKWGPDFEMGSIIKKIITLTLTLPCV